MLGASVTDIARRPWVDYPLRNGIVDKMIHRNHKGSTRVMERTADGMGRPPTGVQRPEGGHDVKKDYDGARKSPLPASLWQIRNRTARREKYPDSAPAPMATTEVDRRQCFAVKARSVLSDDRFPSPRLGKGIVCSK